MQLQGCVRACEGVQGRARGGEREAEAAHLELLEGHQVADVHHLGAEQRRGTLGQQRREAALAVGQGEDVVARRQLAQVGDHEGIVELARHALAHLILDPLPARGLLGLLVVRFTRTHARPAPVARSRLGHVDAQLYAFDGVRR